MHLPCDVWVMSVLRLFWFAFGMCRRNPSLAVAPLGNQEQLPLATALRHNGSARDVAAIVETFIACAPEAVALEHMPKLLDTAVLNRQAEAVRALLEHHSAGAGLQDTVDFGKLLFWALTAQPSFEIAHLLAQRRFLTHNRLYVLDSMRDRVHDPRVAELLPLVIAANQPMTAHMWSYMPTNCPYVLRALPAVPEGDWRHLARAATPSDRARLHCALLCLSRKISIALKHVASGIVCHMFTD